MAVSSGAVTARCCGNAQVGIEDENDKNARKGGGLTGRKVAEHTPFTAAAGVEQAIRMLDGRWKLVILFHLFGGKLQRFSDLERAIPAISQKMLSCGRWRPTGW